MEIKVKKNTIYHCSLERAFKTPMLCDISKIHTGYGFMPKITHSTDDEHWGKSGFGKKIYAAKSWIHKVGFISIDKVIDRIENKYWRIEVGDFQHWMLGFSKFVGEWQTTEIQNNEILVEYTYTLHSDTVFLYPLNWLFARVFWRIYMNRVLENVKQMAYNHEPYAHK